MYTHIPYLSVIYDEMSFYDKNQFCYELIKHNNLNVFKWVRARNDSKYLESYWKQKELGESALLSGNLNTIEYINRHHIHVALSVNKDILIEITRRGNLNVLEYLHDLSVDFILSEVNSLLNEALLVNNVVIVQYFITTFRSIIVNISHLFSCIIVGNKDILKILLKNHHGRRKERLHEHAGVYLKIKGDEEWYNEFIYENNNVITNAMIDDCIRHKYDIRVIERSAVKFGNISFLIDLQQRHTHLKQINWLYDYLKTDMNYININTLIKYIKLTLTTSDVKEICIAILKSDLFDSKVFNQIQKYVNFPSVLEKDKTLSKKIIKHFLKTNNFNGVKWFLNHNLHIGLTKFNYHKILHEEKGKCVDKLKIMNLLHENHIKCLSSNIIYSIKNTDNAFLLFKWYVKNFGLFHEEDCFVLAMKYGHLDILQYILEKKYVFGFEKLKHSKLCLSYSASYLPLWDRFKHICSFFTAHYGPYWRSNLIDITDYIF